MTRAWIRYSVNDGVERRVGSYEAGEEFQSHLENLRGYEGVTILGSELEQPEMPAKNDLVETTRILSAALKELRLAKERIEHLEGLLRDLGWEGDSQ